MLFFVFFKQKTAYEMRISDWSSDVCSSDLLVFVEGAPLDAELEARRQAKVQGKAYVAPYNAIETMAGQGTLGMELARQAPDLDAVFVCVGGGGDRKSTRLKSSHQCETRIPASA